MKALGALAFDNPAPMKRDTIFRIASITKLITGVAAMILVEECKLWLDESTESWLPELANRRVLKSISSQIDDTVPARRAITVRDLLTFRMGLGSVIRRHGLHRSCGGNDRHPLHTAHDGFALVFPHERIWQTG